MPPMRFELDRHPLYIGRHLQHYLFVRDNKRKFIYLICSLKLYNKWTHFDIQNDPHEIWTLTPYTVGRHFHN